MKLLRLGPPGAERPALRDGTGTLRDLSGVIPDLGPGQLDPAMLDRLHRLDPAALPAVTGAPRIGVPVAGIRNIIAIGLNYRDHAAEAGMALPAEPVVFSKHSGALAGAFDPVARPPGSTKMDWEVELAVVIGRTASQVSEARALDHVAGYCTVNDLSERAFQIERGGQWIKGKSAPGFCPLGPWLVTADEVPDPQALRLWCRVNGETMQDGTTADMVFPVRMLISYLSRFMTLLPGDVICTGTPAGVGLGRGRFLQPGDEIRLAVEGLGEQCQRVIDAAA